MSAPDTLRSINCTSCGAGLSVLGGGRVAARGCEYCGALLDAQDNYKILEKYDKAPRPDSPISLGMTGALEGVDWTVIGTLQVIESYAGQRWEWVEHQLFSPTHGYCWIAVEDGHFSFTRKVRGMGNSGWWTEARVNRSENQPGTYWDGGRYKYYESGTSQIAYAEGSFNFAPRRGDRTPYVTFMSDTHQLTQASNGPEREIELTSYLAPEQVQTAFGLETVPDLKGVHPLQPFAAWKHGAFLRNMGFLSAAVAIFLWATLAGGSATILNEPNIPTTRPIALAFEISNASDLVTIRMTSNASNGWAWYDLELVDPSGETVVEFGRQSEFYFGRQDGENWSEGARTATATLRLPGEGVYTLNIEQSEAGTWSNGTRPSAVSVTVEEGVKATFWLLVAAALSAIAGIGVLGRRMFHNARRWSGSDWSDED
ncbi:MAG: hypothetical protein ACI95S_002442 [Dinoroseobacter sp.]|jgi:hypothetical protein